MWIIINFFTGCVFGYFTMAYLISIGFTFWPALVIIVMLSAILGIILAPIEVWIDDYFEKKRLDNDSGIG